MAYGEDAGGLAMLADPSEVFDTELIQIEPPALPAGISDAVISSASIIAGLPPIIDADSSSDQVHSAADRVTGVSGMLADVAGKVGANVRIGVAGITSGARALIPAEVFKAARQLGAVADGLGAQHAENAQAMAVFRNDRVQIKASAKGISGQLGGEFVEATAIAGALQSAQQRLGSMAPSPGVAAPDRIQAGAFAGNLKRNADQLVFAVSEGRRQLESIAGRIDG